MTKVFLLDIDLNGNEILRPVIHNSNADPEAESSKAGQLYYNTSDGTIRLYDGIEWTILPDARIILANELTTAMSLNDLNHRLKEIEESEFASSEDVLSLERIIEETQLNSASAFNDLDQRLIDLENTPSSVGNYTKTITEGSEVSIAMSEHNCGMYPIAVAYYESTLVPCSVISNKGDLTISWSGVELSESNPLIIKILG